MQLAQRSRIWRLCVHCRREQDATSPIGGENSPSTEFYFWADFFLGKLVNGNQPDFKSRTRSIQSIFGDIRRILEPVRAPRNGWVENFRGGALSASTLIF
jgi:hypothetical protein